MKHLFTAMALAALCALPTLASFSSGNTAYTKRVNTALLEEPKPLAKPLAHVGYARKLSVDEVKGAWVLVREGKNKGWVFSGNLAEQKPEEIKGADGLPLEASKTSASIAARPLAPAASDYADRRGYSNAREDIVWLEKHADAIKEAQVRAYQEEHKKGEYQ